MTLYYIYKICCKNFEITDVYIGSTKNFNRRKYSHKTNCKKINDNYDSFVYKFIRDNGGWNNWCMIEIEKIECETRQESFKKERYWVEKLKPSLNKVIPANDKNVKEKEYYEKNKKNILTRKKENYENNKIEILEKLKKTVVCEKCKKEFSISHKSRHEKTQYHINNSN